MKRPRPPLAAALVLALALPASANSSISYDFNNMTYWLSHEMAQGLAFNAGSTFDPPKEIKGWYLQPDVSFGVGNMPLDKRDFPNLTVQALKDAGGESMFPSSVLFPNLAMHLRFGLPWRGDAYIRFADATTPPGYKISPTMTAQVQTNSIGAGIRQHFFGGDYPLLTLGAHYNHVQGRTHLKGKFNENIQTLNLSSDLVGDIDWSINSFGLTAVTSYTWGRWTPYAGLGYNYATGSVRARLDLEPNGFGAVPAIGEGSDRPEKSQGRELFGFSYDRPTWSAFLSGELKALGQLQYRSYIVQVGAALPFDIGGRTIFHKRRPPVAPNPVLNEPKTKTRWHEGPKPDEKAAPDMIFLR
ncbi:MAG: hypothetical protein KGM24_06880 [Elusimicrobia bacterium]|nr:hypothetical protein [Elusimicrobiota bacterium]